jgi:hypothetical protein
MEGIGMEFDVRECLGVFRLPGGDGIGPDFMKEVVTDPFLKVGEADPEGFLADIALTGAGEPGKVADKEADGQKKANKIFSFHPLPIF